MYDRDWLLDLTMPNPEVVYANIDRVHESENGFGIWRSINVDENTFQNVRGNYKYYFYKIYIYIYIYMDVCVCVCVCVFVCLCIVIILFLLSIFFK